MVVGASSSSWHWSIYLLCLHLGWSDFCERKQTNPWYSASSFSDTLGSSNCLAINSVECRSGSCSACTFLISAFETGLRSAFLEREVGLELIQRRTPSTTLVRLVSFYRIRTIKLPTLVAVPSGYRELRKDCGSCPWPFS